MRNVTLLLLLAAPALAGGGDDAKSANAAKADRARKAAAANPSDIGAWLALADALFADDQPADAWEALEGAIAKNPKEVRLSLKLGDAFMLLAEKEQRESKDGQTIINYYLDAERNYGEALKKDAKCAEAVYGMARVNYDMGRDDGKEKARTLLAQCLAIDGNHARAHALLAYMLYLEGMDLTKQRKDVDAKAKYQAAEEEYALALKLGDSEVVDGVRYGHTLLAQGRTDDAKKAYLTALQKHPESNLPVVSGLYHVANRGEAKPSWGNPKLKPLFEEAVKEAPKSPVAWYYLGYCQSLAQDWDQALKSFGNAMDLDPKNATYIYQVGYMHETLGDEEKAIDAYRKALSAFPDYKDATDRFYGLIVAKPKDIDRAEKLFEELIRLSPNTAYIHNDYALILRNWSEATKTATDKDPPAEVKRRLKRSGEVYEIAAKLAPEEPQILSDTGLLFWFYPCNFDAKKATGYLKRSLDQSDYAYLDAWNGLDQLCRKVGDWDTLADYAERVVGSMERGNLPTSPVGGGAPEPRPNEKDGMQARAEAALDLAQKKLKKS